MRDRQLVDDVRRALANPRKVADALGLKVFDDAGKYVLVSCPAHAERTGSCSLLKKNGTLGVKCHGCKWTGDVLTLIAQVNGLDLKTGFREVLATACELAGMQDEAEAVRDGKPAPERAERPAPAPPEPEPEYPPAGEVAELWDTARPVTGDAEATALLVSRRIDPDAVEGLDLARVLEPETHFSRMPRWAYFKGRAPVSRSWLKTGHRMLLPAFDAAGGFRSVRAWLVRRDPDMPKRVPPSGHRASGLVLANARARRWLRGDSSPSTIIVCEGEPDTLVRAVLCPNETIVGIGSGSWGEDFAERVPYGARVAVMTHLDKAGDIYAASLVESLKHRAQVVRWKLTEVA